MARSRCVQLFVRCYFMCSLVVVCVHTIRLIVFLLLSSLLLVFLVEFKFSIPVTVYRKSILYRYIYICIYNVRYISILKHFAFNFSDVKTADRCLIFKHFQQNIADFFSSSFSICKHFTFDSKGYNRFELVIQFQNN